MDQFSFPEVYDTLTNTVVGGEKRFDQLTPGEQLVIQLGRGERTMDSLTPDESSWFKEKFWNQPGWASDIVKRGNEVWINAKDAIQAGGRAIDALDPFQPEPDQSEKLRPFGPSRIETAAEAAVESGWKGLQAVFGVPGIVTAPIGGAAQRQFGLSEGGRTAVEFLPEAVVGSKGIPALQKLLRGMFREDSAKTLAPYLPLDPNQITKLDATAPRLGTKLVGSSEPAAEEAAGAGSTALARVGNTLAHYWNKVKPATTHAVTGPDVNKPWDVVVDERFARDVADILGPQIRDFQFPPGTEKVVDKITFLLQSGQAADPRVTHAFREAAAEAGRRLQVLSQYADQGTGKRNTGPLAKAYEALNQADRTSYAAATLSIITAARNATQQAVRQGLEVPLEGLVGFATKGSWASLRDMGNTMRGWNLTPAESNKINEILNAHGNRYLRELFAGRSAMTEAGGDITPALQKALDWLNVLNRRQESWSRYVAMNGFMHREMARRGLDYAKTPVDQIPIDLVAKGVNRALEVTYSLPPAGKWEAELISTIDKLNLGPLGLRSLMPYSRFNLSNAMKEMYAWSPAGPFTPKAWKTIIEGTPEQAARVLGKAAIGTEMMFMGQAMKEDPSGKWYEVWWTGDNGEKRKIDMRAYHPFDVMLFVGELINRPPGSPGYRLTVDDYREALTGFSRIEGTGIQLIDLARGFSSGERLQHFFETVGAQWLGRMSAAGRTPKAIQEIWDPNEATPRDVTQGETWKERIFAPFRGNIPGESRLLPERQEMFLEKREDRTGFPAVARVFGINVQNVNPVEAEIARLGHTGTRSDEDWFDVYGDKRPLEQSFLPREGSRKMNYEMKKHLGKMSETFLDQLIKSKGYVDVGDKTRRWILHELAAPVMKGAAKGMSLSNSDIAREYMMKRLQRRLNVPTLEMLREQGFPIDELLER